MYDAIMNLEWPGSEFSSSLGGGCEDVLSRQQAAVTAIYDNKYPSAVAICEVISSTAHPQRTEVLVQLWHDIKL